MRTFWSLLYLSRFLWSCSLSYFERAYWSHNLLLLFLSARSFLSRFRLPLLLLVRAFWSLFQSCSFSLLMIGTVNTYLMASSSFGSCLLVAFPISLIFPGFSSLSTYCDTCVFQSLSLSSLNPLCTCVYHVSRRQSKKGSSQLSIPSFGYWL